MKGELTDPTLDDWQLIQRLLPTGWETQAKRLGALRRVRAIRDPAGLLRVLLVHLADGCSLAETAARAAELGWCRLSVVAVIKRLRAAGPWLNWLCQGLWAGRGRRLASLRRRVRAVDSTMVMEGGRTGSQWRIHYALNLADLRCDFFQLTAQHVGESLAHFPVQKGDLLVGDRGLAHAAGIVSVLRRGGDVLVRTNLHNLPLFSPEGRRLRLLPRLRRLRVGTPVEWPAYVRAEDRALFAGRLVAIRRSARASAAARRRAQRKAERNHRALRADTLEAAAYVLLWTSLPGAELPAGAALELYRLRWQVELAFKRSKSLLGLGQLPKRNDDSAKAWLHGKLLVALLIERLIVEAEALSPWGYPLAAPPQPLARSPLAGP
jgi:hypothetical protein